MGVVACVVLLTAEVMRRFTPDFGKLAAEEAELEGEWRSDHARVVKHAEEIAFYDAADTEKATLSNSFGRLWDQIARVMMVRVPHRIMVSS